MDSNVQLVEEKVRLDGRLERRDTLFYFLTYISLASLLPPLIAAHL
jgi:hypothetical protein